MTSADLDFDRVFPPGLRHLSDVHWTPVAVARRAAQLLVDRPGARILDVGAGVGKACLVGALNTKAEWFGVERDPAHVEAAFTAARHLGVSRRTRFATGDASLIDWSPYDGFYLFNPLGSLMSNAMGIPIALRTPMIEMMATRIEVRLAEARVGTRVVTYHGFGGEMPAGYQLISSERIQTGALQLWIRTA